jgi:hypothetical protein
MDLINNITAKEYSLYDNERFEMDETLYRFRIHYKDKIDFDPYYHQLCVLKCKNDNLLNASIHEQDKIIMDNYREDKLYDNNYFNNIQNIDNVFLADIIVIKNLFDIPLNGLKVTIGKEEFVYIPIYLHLTLRQLKTLQIDVKNITYMDEDDQNYHRRIYN